MTEIKPRYKLILHLSDSSTLAFNIAEHQLKELLDSSLRIYNFDGTVVFFNHVTYMQIIDFDPKLTTHTTEDENLAIKEPYIGSN